ncbi:MAG: zinc ABC transporter substrate-binding protein [Gemmatimonadota bacterium]|nr:zinc ABC transporter substrate-binding protein [Gemmatimonadota bacterium]
MNDTEVCRRRHRVRSSFRFCGWFGASLLALSLSVGCRTAETSDLPLVMVSVPPQVQMVEAIAGPLVRVEIMVPPGANPTTYEPTVGQMRSLGEALLYVEIGHPAFAFEKAWLDGMLAENPEILVVDASGGSGADGEDPHLWLDPEAAAEMVRRTVAGLKSVLPDHGRLFEENGGALLLRLEEVDLRIRAIFEGTSGGTFAVYHDAWRRFARAYGLVQLAIEDEGKEPSAGDIAEKIASMREMGIKMVFGQPQFSMRSVNTIAAEVGAEVGVLDPLAPDWLENLERSARLIAETLNR